ncbi:MAG TPA: HesA/MoeB/ThiF family protein [bacterium]
MEKLKILVVGVGGLGCPASLGLAEAGVETLGLMDPDKVEVSNLHRQVLYSKGDVGNSKVEAAAKFLRRNYPSVNIIPLMESMTTETMNKYLKDYDLVVDGLDRLEKKFFLNDKCVQARKPFVHAGVVKFEGQVLAIQPGVTACLRCLIPKIPPPFAMPTCQEAGVLGSFSQTIGYLQAHEALRLVAKKDPFRLWKLDAQKRETRSIVPQRNPECEACGKGKVGEKPMETACAS